MLVGGSIILAKSGVKNWDIYDWVLWPNESVRFFEWQWGLGYELWVWVMKTEYWVMKIEWALNQTSHKHPPPPPLLMNKLGKLAL